MKKLDKILNLILILLAIIIGVVFIYQYFDNKSNEAKIEKYKEQYSYLSTNDLHNCKGLFNYSNEKVSYDNVDTNTKLCVSYYKSEKNTTEEKWKKDKKKNTCTKDKMVFRIDDDSDSCSISIFNKDSLVKTYNKIFNKEFDENKFQIDDLHICYIKDDNIYCGLSEVYTIVIENDYNVYRVIDNIKEKSSSVEIYDYFLKKDENTCYNYYTTQDINDKCTESIKKNKTINYKNLKKYGTLYKHTYEKNENGEYYWVSSEPVQK